MLVGGDGLHNLPLPLDAMRAQQDKAGIVGPTSVSLLERLGQHPLQEDWTRFVALYQPFIERFIRLDLTLAPDAEDICQEVMKKLVEHLPQFRRQRDGSFRTWLKTITANEVNYFWRKRLRRPSMGGGQDGLALDKLHDPTNELSQWWDREHGGHILRTLQELVAPEFATSTWNAFRLRVAEGKSTAEVASILGISPNAVDIAKSRVLARLRQEAAGLIEE